MGQVGSTGELTQEGIKQIKDVKEADVMMNLIFRYMLKQINVNDFLKLSQPDTCKEYVISLAEHMSSQFSHLQITPYREKHSDILLFTKYSELDPSKKSATHSEEEKKSLCLILSYYYTRIFQIYGALAITLLNDISSSQTVSQSSTGSDRSLNRTPGSKMISAASLIGGTRGGADMTEIQASSFGFLSSYFMKKEEKDAYQLKRGWQTKYDEDNINGGRVYFDKIETITSSSSDKTDIGRFIIHPPAIRDRYLILEVSAKWVSGTNFDASLVYKSLKSSDSPSSTLSLPDSLKVPVTMERKQDSSYMVKVKKTNGVAIMDIPHYFQGVFQELITAFPLKGRTLETSDEASYNEEGISNPLRIGIIKTALEERRTVGHCIARALQLLRTIPATATKDASFESDICMEKFTFTSRTHKGVISSSDKARLLGIPERGASLLKDKSAGSRGFHPLVQLFYDTIRIGSPQIIMGDTAFTEYQAFMKKMAYLYWDDVPTATPGMTIHEGIAQISNKRDKAMCDTELNKKDAVITVDPTIVKVNEVSRVVKELYTIQANHAKRCGEIFKLLFDITYDEKKNPLMISLNKTLLQGGFKELRRINGLARNVLIDYYSMCEQKYVQGVNLIVEPIRRERREREVKRSADETRAAQAIHLAARTAPALPLQRSMSNQTPARPTIVSSPLFTFSTPSNSAVSARPLATAAVSKISSNTSSNMTAKAISSLKKQYTTGGTRKRHVMRQ
jgi:hypothetical protein